MFYIILYVLAIVAFFCLISIPLTILEKRQAKRNIEKFFAGRQELDERQFYERYFENSEIPFYVVSTVRNALEYQFGEDMSRLNPEDKFYDLSFKWVDNYIEDTEILYFLEEKLGIEMADSEIAPVETVNELVNLAWRKIQEREIKNDTFSH